MKKQKKEQENTNEIMKRNASTLKEANEDRANAERRLDYSQQRYGKLDEKYKKVLHDLEDMTTRFEEKIAAEDCLVQIRHTQQRYS
jgi:hypothetical protein